MLHVAAGISLGILAAVGVLHNPTLVLVGVALLVVILAAIFVLVSLDVLSEIAADWVERWTRQRKLCATKRTERKAEQDWLVASSRRLERFEGER